MADLTKAFTTVFAAALAALVAGYGLVPDVREWLGSRGGLIAWTATGMLAIALAAGVWAYRRSTEESSFRLLIPVTSVVLLAQSFRFGADALGYDPPAISGVDVASLVDLRDLVAETAVRLHLGALVGLLTLTLIMTVAGWIGYEAWTWARSRIRVTETAVVAYYVASLAVHASIPVMGFFGDGLGAWFITNLAALVAAGLLVVAGLAAGDHRTTVTGWRRRMWAWLGSEQPLAGTPVDLGS